MAQVQSFYIFVTIFALSTAGNSLELVLLTFAQSGTDEYNRFVRSANFFNIDVVAMGEEDISLDMCRQSSDGAESFQTLEDNFKKYGNHDELVLMLANGFDIVVRNASTILDAFSKMKARIVFSSEKSLLHERADKQKFPAHYIGMIGYKGEFFTALKDYICGKRQDVEVCIADVCRNETQRTKFSIVFDDTSIIFHNLNQKDDEIELQPRRNSTIARNTKYNTFPAMLRGSNATNLRLNQLSNYIPDGWHPRVACQRCEYNVVNHSFDDEKSAPHVFVAIFLLQGSPFLEEFFNRFAGLSYPKSRITLLINSRSSEHERVSARFLTIYRKTYKSVHSIPYFENKSDESARQLAASMCVQQECDFFFSIDSSVQITNPMTLKYLIRKNRNIIAPLVKKHNKLWSNFWGAINNDGYYSRSDDYLEIIGNEKIGVWNVPFINSIYLIRNHTLKNLLGSAPHLYFHGDHPTDMAFCHHIRENRFFMFVSNEENFGRLLDIDESIKRETKVHPDLWEIERNEVDWLERYIHSDFWNVLNGETELDIACPEVYRFPLTTEKFADEIVDTVEAANLWCNASIIDPRIEGGYQGAPSVDVHSRQFGFHDEWIQFLVKYISRLVPLFFHGYGALCKTSKMFIVRYRADELADVIPHHDDSTVTINLALNTQKKDYEGGGCHFIRQNCSVIDLPKGWAVIHPGKLTHYHEGLTTTKGVRYIMVSFIDP